MEPPPITGLLETVLYCSTADEDSVHRFYSETLGLRRLSPDGAAYRIGPSILLVFNRDRSSVQAEPPPHGATGPAHACFLAARADYDRWRQRLSAAGVRVTDERTWSNGARSLYFEDPAGNVLEIADGDPWPR